MNDSQKIIWLTLFLGKGGLGSTKFVAFETLAWHNECFFCNICKDSMVGKGFIQVNTWFQESKNVLHITIMGDRETLFFSGWWKHHLPWVRKEEDDGGDWGRMNNTNPTQFWMFTYSNKAYVYCLGPIICRLCIYDVLYYMFQLQGAMYEWCYFLVVCVIP